MIIEQIFPSFYIAHTKTGVWASGESFTDAITNLLKIIKN